MDLRNDIDIYLAELGRSLEALDRVAVAGLARALMAAWRERRQVLIIGNGGSAALAAHMVNDLNKIVVPGLPRWRAIALSDNIPLLTAWANDEAYERVFAEPIQNLCQPGDLVVAVSCSGNSRNVIEGVRAARTLGARVAVLTGDRGGQLTEMGDVVVRAPVSCIGQQEDIHMVLDHLVTRLLRRWAAAIADRQARPPRALVLAAGEGTRLRPLTADRPKPMLPVAGAPILEHTLAWLGRHGVREVAINLHYRGEAIVRHFGDGAAHGITITYSHEETLLGSAGAARRLASFLSGGPFVVVYGDVLTDLDLGRLLLYHHEQAVCEPGASATLSLYRVPNPTEVGLVGRDASGRLTRFIEKPRPEEVFTDLANAGVMVLEPEALEAIPAEGYSDFGQHVLPGLLADGRPVYGWVVRDDEYVLDVGTPEKYRQAEADWPRRMSRWNGGAHGGG